MGQNNGYYKPNPGESLILKDIWKAVGKSRGFYPDEMRAWLQGQNELIAYKLPLMEPQAAGRARRTLAWIRDQIQMIPASLPADEYVRYS